jgi:RHH-type rel operon transcriptional repressor/antitoxin RelB
VAISLRLERELERTLDKCARSEGKSKSELIRSLISDFVAQQSKSTTPWELGKDLFGLYGSGKGNLSVDRKKILKEKLHAKKSGC